MVKKIQAMLIGTAVITLLFPVSTMAANSSHSVAQSIQKPIFHKVKMDPNIRARELSMLASIKQSPKKDASGRMFTSVTPDTIIRETGLVTNGSTGTTTKDGPWRFTLTGYAFDYGHAFSSYSGTVKLAIVQYGVHSGYKANMRWYVDDPADDLTVYCDLPGDYISTAAWLDFGAFNGGTLVARCENLGNGDTEGNFFAYHN